MKKVIAILTAFILCLSLSAAWAEDVAALTRAAEAGDTGAMYRLGTAYYQGDGTAQDYPLAAYWWYKAADAGDPGAMCALG